MTDEENDRPAWGKRDPLEVEAKQCLSFEPRIRGGYSLHSEHRPELCIEPCQRHIARVVDCCKADPDRDVIECPKCGEQRSVPCSFDEEFS